MKNKVKILGLLLSLFMLSCNTNNLMEEDALGAKDGTFSLSGRDKGESSGGGSGTGQGNGGQAGVITAAEWNDLSQWDFWNNLLNEKEFSEKPKYWDFYTNNRVSAVVLKLDNQPFVDACLELKRGAETIWTARTDNQGKAELWEGLFQKQTGKTNGLSLWVNDKKVTSSVKFFKDGVNEIVLKQEVKTKEPVHIDLAFVVDATGSMGDEMTFLKEDLKSVISKIKESNASIRMHTGTVFYRDKGDDYVTKHSAFTSDFDTTLKFIRQQKAGGGGDFPEAVDEALGVALSELQWSSSAKARIAFLLLDAPPHYNPQVVQRIHKIVAKMASKGIKIIPITASGIDKNTEFLMRFMSITTNGTYVFITNDSGVGNEHLQASVGQYEVEKLNDLLVRLVNKYTE